MLALELLNQEEDRLMQQKTELLCELREIENRLREVVKEASHLLTWRDGVNIEELKTLSKLKAVVRLREGRLCLIDAKQVVEKMEWFVVPEDESEETNV